MISGAQVRFDDQAARERIRNSLDESLIVEASAGTGKTTEMVNRIVRVLETGRARIDQIVAVTFTHKAAGEMKLRLRQVLDSARTQATDEAARRNLEDALEHLEEAAIGTIHSFCAQVLRERPVEACVDPAFQEVAESESGRLYADAFRAWFERKLNQPAPGLRRALVRLAWRDSTDMRPPMNQIKDAAWKLIEWRDYPAAWRRDPFPREEEITLLVEQARELARLSAQARRTTDDLFKSLRPVREFAIWMERSGKRDADTIEGMLLKLLRDQKRLTWKGRGVFSDTVTRETVVEARDALVAALERFRRRADADLASLLRDELEELVDQYAAAKQRAGKLDFTDLLLKVRDLVRSNASVRSYLQNRFTHVFVDEFQDTDPLQAEVLLLVACGDPCETDWKAAAPAPGKLFVVGDPKQSIYKFRRADVGLYQEVSLALAERGVGFVHLTRSFRSVRPIQECVNAAFAPEMTGDPAAGQAMYAPLEEHAQSIGGQPSVIALPAPKPYGSRNVAKANINSCLPEAIVAFTEWLLNESGWKVRDPEESHQLVDVTARHVAILFRRFTNFGQDLTRDYTRGLEARGIPHLLVGSKSFHRREEVESLRAALAAIEWPDDELSVFATLKGPLFAISDESLLRFHLEHGRLHPFRRFGEEVRSDFRDLAEALGILAELHRDRNRRPFVETVNRLLEVARAHAGFAMRPGGQQVLANVYRVCDLARGFEVEGGISFRGFVEELEAQAERAESAEAPVLEEGAEGVRLITVHSAKGLEFPVVILADMTANLAAWEPERYVDAQRGLCAMRLLRCAPVELAEHEAEEKAREESEGVRVAYVAATRARDLLVVPAVGDQECDGWVRPLNKAIYPPRMSFRNAGRAAGCPSFGQATVLERPPEYMTGNEISVKPGAHTPRGGSHEVVWWDPSKLTLGVAADFGLRQEEILAEAPNDSLARFRAWETARQLSGERGSRPALMPFTATEAGQPPDDFSCDVALAFTDRATARPSGRRFGTLVHSVLSEADLKAERAPVARIASLHGSIIGASPAEIAAATDAVLATLAHPLIDRARSAMKVRREAPVTLRMGERLMEGIIDLAFEDESGWTIVDFKTDADLPSAQEGYRAQLAWYALALERSTGKPARAVLLGV